MSWRIERHASLRMSPISQARALVDRLRMQVPNGAQPLHEVDRLLGVRIPWQKFGFSFFAKEPDHLGAWMELKDTMESAFEEVGQELIKDYDHTVAQHYYPGSRPENVVYLAWAGEGKPNPIRVKSSAEMLADLEEAGYGGVPIGMSVEHPWDVGHSLVVPAETRTTNPMILVSDSENEVNWLWRSVMRGVLEKSNSMGYFFAPGLEGRESAMNLQLMTAGDVNMTTTLVWLADLAVQRARGSSGEWGMKDMVVMLHDFGAQYNVYPEGLHNRGTFNAIAALSRSYPAIKMNPIATMSSGEYAKFMANKRFGLAQITSYQILIGKVNNINTARALVGEWGAEELMEKPEGMIVAKESGSKWWLLKE